MEIITQQNDRVDLICLRILGNVEMVEQVLDLNPGLAAYGPILPMGVTVKLPQKTENPPRQNQIKLWD